MPDLFVGGRIVGNYIQTHGNVEGGDYASIGTGPYCCHGTSIVPQHMGMAQKPPVKRSSNDLIHSHTHLYLFGPG